MKKKRRIPYPIKVAFNCIIYAIFFAYMIQQIITTEDPSLRLFVIFLTVVFGGSAVLYEYLRYNFDVATQNLIFWGDPEKALTMVDRVSKLDILKTFSTSIDIMHMLAYVDLRRFDDLKKYIAGLTDEKRQVYDVLIVLRYAQMVMYGETGETEKMENAYRQLNAMRDRKVKGKRMKGSLFFNWDLMAGLRRFYQGSSMEALTKLKEVDTENMNFRERMQLYMTQARICAKVGRLGELKNHIEELDKVVGKNPVAGKMLEEMKAMV